MDVPIIGKEEFENAEKIEIVEKPKVELITLDEKLMADLLIKMQNPVELQKELAVKIKVALDNKIKVELGSNGFLSDSTRRWVGEYNSILEKIQKALYGDKSVSLHLHKVTHSQIAAKIRKSSNEAKTDN